jgi:hypothetical protein
MSTSGIESTGSPVRMGWALGLLTLCGVVFASTFVPAVAVLALGGSAGAGGAAMFGGFMAGLLAYLGLMRLGVRRGWWS